MNFTSSQCLRPGTALEQNSSVFLEGSLSLNSLKTPTGNNVSFEQSGSLSLSRTVSASLTRSKRPGTTSTYSKHTKKKSERELLVEVLFALQILIL